MNSKLIQRLVLPYVSHIIETGCWHEKDQHILPPPFLYDLEHKRQVPNLLIQGLLTLLRLNVRKMHPAVVVSTGYCSISRRIFRHLHAQKYSGYFCHLSPLIFYLLISDQMMLLIHMDNAVCHLYEMDEVISFFKLLSHCLALLSLAFFIQEVIRLFLSAVFMGTKRNMEIMAFC